MGATRLQTVKCCRYSGFDAGRSAGDRWSGLDAITRRLRIFFGIVLLGALATTSLAAPGTLEEIRINGLFRMTRAGFLHALGAKEGDAYDPAQLRRKYLEIWDLRLFEDMTFNIEPAPDGGVALIVVVRERPVLSSIEYQENKAVNQTQIEDSLREREVRLDLGRPVDEAVLAETASVIRDLLGQRGHLDPTVDYHLTNVTETSRSARFDIAPGAKTRIRKIVFRGNERFPARVLRQQLELTDSFKWFWPWSKKTLYHPLKWDQDSGRIRDLYQAFGYLDVDLKAPVVDVRRVEKKKKKAPPKVEVPSIFRVALLDVEKKLARDGLSPKRRRELRARRGRLESRAEKALAKAEIKANAAGKQWAYLTVDVSEGPQYRLGEVEISGNSKLTDKDLKRNVFLRPGEILSETSIDLTINSITRRYEDMGHLYANVNRRIDRRDGEEPVADVEIQILEDHPYLVDRIEFSGNTSTQDKVLRREVLLSEGENFNRTRLDFSRRKLNQLGYWVIQEDPEIQPVETASDDVATPAALGDDDPADRAVHITFAGEEQGRNEIQIGGGYSGLDGAFFSGIYSTRNFLGRGQVLSTSLQIGGRANRYSISFTEPWFLNRPITFGFSLFRRDVEFGTISGSRLDSSSEGLGLVLGRRTGRFSTFTVGYNYESVRSTSSLSTDLALQTAEQDVSSLTPAWIYNTVNNPYRPSSGQRFGVTLQTAGGELGGDTAFIKPLVQYTLYKNPRKRKGFFGFNAETGWIGTHSGGSDPSSAVISGIPRFQRYWLGGDLQGPRVFETRTISPRRYVELLQDPNDPNRVIIGQVLGDPRNSNIEDFTVQGGVPALLEVGGDRFYLIQSEYVWPLNEQADLALFFDMGDSLFEDSSFNFDTLRMSAGVELRFHLPVFPVPLRLIYGVPIRQLDLDRTGNFQFSIGRSF